MADIALIVDDEKTIRDLLEAFLETEGYETYTASSGIEGLRQVYEKRPDIVISDVVMSGMDGYEFSRLVRDACDAPIIMLTGLAEVAPDAPSLNIIDAFIAKPIKIHDLLAQVAALLSDKRPIGKDASV